jgi:dTDP-D-glucose 4,6-dehydratase
LGYVPQVSMQEGIRRAAQWYVKVAEEEKKQSDAFRKLV